MVKVTDTLITAAAEGFFGRSDVRGSLEWLGRRLPAEATIYVAGGAIRNLIIDVLHGGAPATRDLDLFIAGLAGDFDLARALKDQPIAETDLKGLRWQPASSTYAFDLCLLPNFLVISRYHLDPILENLLAGIDFTINAVVFDVGCRALVEKGATAAVRERIIDFNSPWIPDRCLIAYRILLMAYKTGFRFSEAVFRFITKQMDVGVLERTKSILRAKQGRAVAAFVMQGYDRLCRLGSYAAYLADEPSPSLRGTHALTDGD